MRKIGLWTLAAVLVLSPSLSSAAPRGVYVAVISAHGPGLRVNFVCYAEANGRTAVTTSITRCTLKFNDGTTLRAPAVTMPGIIAVTGAAGLHKWGPHTACITGKVRYADGDVRTNSYCYQAPN